jgi:hypothetical protein
MKPFGNLGVYWRMILKWILRKQGGKAWTFGSGEGKSAGSKQTP